MFSTDKNIETIGELVEAVKKYVGHQSEYLKLDISEKIVRLITALLVSAVIVVLLLIALIYLSFAAAFALATCIGNIVGAFAIVGAFYLVVLLLVVLFRHQWIEKPLVRFLASMILES